MVGMESEAYIFQRGPNGEWVPYETPGAFVYGTGPFTDPAGSIDDIWAMAARCGLPIESINAEFAAPPFESTSRYADASRAADDVFSFRQMARESSIRRGYSLSFSPKPFAEKSGSGSHFNISFTEHSGRNAFADDVANGEPSRSMAGCIAGSLQH
ncbi:hypothetical protein OY671_012051, partial [Metschnikowia pulcherrima]